MAVTFGRVPKPPVKRRWSYKPPHTGSGWGYDYVPNGRKIVGMVHHEWLGVGSESFHTNFFACQSAGTCPSDYNCAAGERCPNALVDFIILKDGTIIEINNPFGERAGWASGGNVTAPGGLEGDGPAFVSKFGIAAINQRLSPIEYQKLGDEQFTLAQIESGGRLAAWIHDQDGQLWSEHPYTSKHGIVTSFLHFEFGTTSCGKNELDDITKVQAVTRQVMRQYQEQISVPDPIPPDVPPLPEPDLPGGITLEQAKERFGTLQRYNRDGSMESFPFDPKGPISLAWAHRSAIAGEWPKAGNWEVLRTGADVAHVITFANGWLLANLADRGGWNWVTLSGVQA